MLAFLRKKGHAFYFWDNMVAMFIKFFCSQSVKRISNKFFILLQLL